VPSGNVSLYNETAKGSVLPTPTVLGLGIVEDVRKCITTDLKKEGNLLYLVGETKEEFGGSAVYRRYGGKGGVVPEVIPERLKRSMDEMHAAMRKGLVRSCHDVSDGGIAVAVAEMCLGGNIGAYVKTGYDKWYLFSESSTRWIGEIEPCKKEEFLASKTVPVMELGKVGGKSLRIKDRCMLVNVSLNQMRKAWSGALPKLMG
jgi:phosphoribosylformylglycinamidine synthase